MSTDTLSELAAELIDILIRRGETVATAESCTGGAICSAITDIPGSSEVLWGGVVSYADDAKIGLLDIDPVIITREGAVSSVVAKSMAWGIRVRSGADWTVAVTGIAGPGGGTPEKPVGTVWIAWCNPEGAVTPKLFHFDGSRPDVKKSTVREALRGLLELTREK